MTKLITKLLVLAIASTLALSANAKNWNNPNGDPVNSANDTGTIFITYKDGEYIATKNNKNIMVSGAITNPFEQFINGIDSTKWIKSYTSENNKVIVAEYTPPTEEVQNWKNIIALVTDSRFLGLSLTSFGEMTRKSYSENCLEGFKQTIFSEDKIPADINSGYENDYFLMECGKYKNSEKKDITLFRNIAADNALYSISRSWRKLISKEELRNGFKDLSQIEVCDNTVKRKQCLSKGYKIQENGKGNYLDAIQAIENGEHKTGVDILLRLSELGDSRSQSELGLMYLLGTIIGKDKKLAIELFKKSAKQGDSFGQTNLGNIYSSFQDYKKAFKWYKKAAAQGNSSAQRNLGELYLSGWGVEKNIDKAREWLRKAANQGHISAKKTLQEINGKH